RGGLLKVLERNRVVLVSVLAALAGGERLAQPELRRSGDVGPWTRLCGLGPLVVPGYRDPELGEHLRCCVLSPAGKRTGEGEAATDHEGGREDRRDDLRPAQHPWSVSPCRDERGSRLAGQDHDHGRDLLELPGQSPLLVVGRRPAFLVASGDPALL